MNETYIKNVVEAALLAAGRPLQLAELTQLFDENARPDEAGLRAAFALLEADYATRGIEIKETVSGFRIQVRRDLANEVSRLWPERPPRYSRALLETLALIAYRQPITRAEIEAVRGVAVNPNIIKTVIERNWVKVVGTRDVPGRPELLGTSQEFLDYFGLKSLDDLPPLAELKAMGDVNLQLDLAKPGEGDAAAAPGAEGAAANADGAAANAGAAVANTEANAPGAEAAAAGVDGAASADNDAVASASPSEGEAISAASAEGEQSPPSAEGAAPAAPEGSSEAATANTAATPAAPSDVISADAITADSLPTEAGEPLTAAATSGAGEVTAPDLAEAIASLDSPDLTITTEALEVEPDTAAQAVGHMEIESDSGDVTVEVEALTLIEGRIEASIESDEADATYDSTAESASGAESASSDPPQRHDTTLETGEFDISELGVETLPPAGKADASEADESGSAAVIEAEFDAEDLTATAADSDDTEEADDEEELSASPKATTKFVAGPRDNDD